MSFFQAIGKLLEGEKPAQLNPVKTQPIYRAKLTSTDNRINKSAGYVSEANASLVIELKECRVRIAKRERIKPYMVFTDRQLNAIIEAKPINERELLWIEGFNEEKSLKYGKEITGIFRYL